MRTIAIAVVGGKLLSRDVERRMKRSLLFILATLLNASFVGCSNLSGSPDEAAAVAVIQKLGGKVEYNDQASQRRVIKVYLHNTKVQDNDLAALEKLPKLRNLFLGKTQIGDAGLAHLQKSSEIQTLALNSTRVTDEGLKSLSALSNLKTLNVQDTQVTADGVAELRKAIPGATIAR